MVGSSKTGKGRAIMAKTRVGVLFGGCSGEHEVSICSAQAIAGALAQGTNAEKYAVVPVYITKAAFGSLAIGRPKSYGPVSPPLTRVK
jgi:predicted secreted protein